MSNIKKIVQALEDSNILLKGVTKITKVTHPLTNFEIQKYYQNEPRFNGAFSRNNLPKKIKHGAYVINLDEYAYEGIHWIALFCSRNEIVYFDSFGVEHVPKEI